MRRGRRKGKVLLFRRGARRLPGWDMGTPPGQPGRSWFGKRTLGIGVATFLALGVAPGLDAASLLWRESDGCRIWMVVDGDTVRMICPGWQMESGRILGVDTPEMRAQCRSELVKAWQATYLLRWRLWTSYRTWAHGSERDRYGRLLVRVAIDKVSVPNMMIEAGLGRPYDGGRRESWCGDNA